ncbi:MAG: HAMP domain-containing histidine kinase [Lachnospiraceae bacterium]|nr:HAMP domain-containing histidine kinase [Lachnospiraceae bacterium]
MQNQAVIMGNQLANAGCFFSATISDTLQVQLRQMASDFDGRIMVVDASFMVMYDSLGLDTGMFILDSKVLEAFNTKVYTNYNTTYSTYEMVVPVSSGSSSPLGLIIVHGSVAILEDEMADLKEKVVIVDIMALLVVVLLAVVAALWMGRPIRLLRESADKVSAGNADIIEGPGYKETDEIIESFNSALTRLKTVDESRQEFVSNVSHELKTPITSIRVLADSLMSMGDAPVELYKEFMQDISNEVDREAKIITDLLDLVKMDKAASALNIAKVNVNALIEDVMHRLLPIADQRKIELVFESFRDVICDADETKLSLAISNLIENAIKYNIDNGFVHVSLNADHRFMYIKVQDSGVGIPEDEQDRIFDRFYRVDKARSRETGGTGLGLAITKSVIQMHSGAIRVYSKPGEGTTFSVRIPLNYKG